jgi:hypothetical protein
MISSRLLIIATATLLIPAPAVLAQNASNPIQVALLRWYQANSAVTFRSAAAANQAPSRSTANTSG